jgi:hypothetical protein
MLSGKKSGAPNGADKHMRPIRATLAAINRTPAVAEAIRRALIA